MQTNLMLLMIPMLMMKMIIVYQGKKGLRFVLSHNKFRYFMVTMFLALVICLCIYSLHYEFRILFLYFVFSIHRFRTSLILCIVFIYIFMYYIDYYYCYYLFACLIISLFFIHKDCLDTYCFSIFFSIFSLYKFNVITKNVMCLCIYMLK